MLPIAANHSSATFLNSTNIQRLGCKTFLEALGHPRVQQWPPAHASEHCQLKQKALVTQLTDFNSFSLQVCIPYHVF